MTPEPREPGGLRSSLARFPRFVHALTEARVFGRAAWASMDESRIFGVAAEMAFWLFLALVPLAAVAYVWLASSGIHAVFDGFEAQTKVNRGWVHKRLWSLASCLALTAAALALGFGGWVSMTLHLGGSLVLGVLVSALVLYLVVAWLYRVGLPDEVRRSIPLWPGTLVVVVTSILCALGYGAFLRVAGDGSVYLAGLAVTAVTMTLLYLLAFALLLGLVVNRTLAATKRENAAPRSGDATPSARA